MKPYSPISPKKIFGVCYFPGQDKLIDKHCFGDCGKIIMGGIVDSLTWYLPCKQEECPHEEKRMKRRKLNTGEMLWLRKLKDE